MAFPRDEVRATIERYHELRRRIDEGLEPDAFGALADFYTDDAVYVDGAWGRLEGKNPRQPHFPPNSWPSPTQLALSRFRLFLFGSRSD